MFCSQYLSQDCSIIDIKSPNITRSYQRSVAAPSFDISIRDEYASYREKVKNKTPSSCPCYKGCFMTLISSRIKKRESNAGVARCDNLLSQAPLKIRGHHRYAGIHVRGSSATKTRLAGMRNSLKTGSLHTF